MSRRVVVWSEAQDLRWAELREGVSATLGRSPSSDIVIGENTVSREHVRVSHQGGRFYVENLSRTNPTLVNGVRVDAPTPIADGDNLDVGLVNLVFHDLAEAYRPAGLVCNHCSRENQASGKDCWYCGTSLVNAPTFVARRLPLVCRIVPASGPYHNLYPDEIFSVGADGKGEVLRGGEPLEGPAATVKVEDGSPVVAPVAAGPIVLVNGEALSGPRELLTGDELRIGAGHFLLIRR